jgi:hypothetical protein
MQRRDFHHPRRTRHGRRDAARRQPGRATAPATATKTTPKPASPRGSGGERPPRSYQVEGAAARKTAASRASGIPSAIPPAAPRAATRATSPATTTTATRRREIDGRAGHQALSLQHRLAAVVPDGRGGERKGSRFLPPPGRRAAEARHHAPCDAASTGTAPRPWKTATVPGRAGRSPRTLPTTARPPCKRLGDRITHWMTINEIMCFTILGYGVDKVPQHAPGTVVKTRKEVQQTVHHALLAHGLGCQAIRAAAPGRCHVSLVENFNSYVPGDRERRAHRGRAARRSFGRGAQRHDAGSRADRPLQSAHGLGRSWARRPRRAARRPGDDRLSRWTRWVSTSTPAATSARPPTPCGYEVLPMRESYPRGEHALAELSCPSRSIGPSG